MKTKICSLILALILILGGSTLVYAAEFPIFDSKKPNVQISSAEGKPGEAVEITVSLNNNPGIWGMRLNIGYDNEQAVIENRVAKTDVFKDLMFSPVENEFVTMVCENTASLSENTKANGEIAVFTFRIADNAKPGNYPVEFLNYNPNDIFDYQTNNVEFTFKNGMITVLPESTPGSSSTTESTAPSVTESPTDLDIRYGDVNTDEKINGKDVMLVRQFIAELIGDDGLNFKAADTSADDKITAKDVMYIRQVIAELISEDKLPAYNK